MTPHRLFKFLALLAVFGGMAVDLKPTNSTNCLTNNTLENVQKFNENAKKNSSGSFIDTIKSFLGFPISMTHSFGHPAENTPSKSKPSENKPNENKPSENAPYFTVPVKHYLDSDAKNTVNDLTEKFEGLTGQATVMNKNWNNSNKVVEEGIKELTEKATEISNKPEIKKLIDTVSDLKNGGLENTVLNMLDSSTNIVAIKIVGLLSTAVGLATLYQWLSSLENGKKPTWVMWLQKVITPATQNPEKQESTQVDSENDDQNEDELTDDEDTNEELADDKKAGFGGFMCKIIPPTIGTIFVLTGLTCILKARAISAFVVGHGSKPS